MSKRPWRPCGAYTFLVIFLIKHRWWWALLATLVMAAGAWRLDGYALLTGGSLSLAMQIALGMAGGAAALMINAILHELFKRSIGARYVRAFQSHARRVLDGMGWPEYVMGGVMAALAEEPMFRGVIVPLFASPALGIATAALVFAACHWLSPRFLPFWLWALWEGVFLGVLLVATGSLLVPMIAHGVHDIVAYRVFAALLPRPAEPVASGESDAGIEI